MNMFLRNERGLKEFFNLYPVISIIVIINLTLWLFFNVLQIGTPLYNFGIGHNLSIHLYGEYWRLITPIFLHAGVTHFIFNSFATVIFGPALELMLGRIKFIIAYLFMGFVGNLGTYL